MTAVFQGGDATNARRAAVTQSDRSPVFQESYGRSAAPPTPNSRTGSDEVLRGSSTQSIASVQQSGTPPSFMDAFSEYDGEAPGVYESPTMQEFTLAESGTQQSFNAFKRPATAQEARRNSIRNTEIASAPAQPEQHRDTENFDFDLRQAIIYSEILTPKYKDYF